MCGGLGCASRDLTFDVTGFAHHSTCSLIDEHTASATAPLRSAEGALEDEGCVAHVVGVLVGVQYSTDLLLRHVRYVCLTGGQSPQ